MTRWSERVQTEGLDRLDELDAIVERLAAQTDESHLEELSRLRFVLTRFRETLTSANAELVTKMALDELGSRATAVINAVQAQLGAAESGQAIDLVPINAAADELLDVLHHLPPAQLDSGGEKAVEEVMVKLRQDAEAVLASFRPQVTQLDEMLEGNQTAAATLDARITEMSSSADQQVARLETALQEQGSRFDEAQESRRGEFTKLIKEQEGTMSASVSALTDSAWKQAEEFENAAKEHIEALDSSQAQAEAMLGAIARSGMAVGYQEHADVQDAEADKYRNYTIGAAALAIGALVWALVHAAYGEPSTQEAVAKVGLSLAIFGLAGYTARQSSNHRDVAQRSRSKQLALASLGPYLAEIDQGRRERVIEAFSIVFFGQGEPGKKVDPGPGQIATVMELLRRDEGSATPE